MKDNRRIFHILIVFVIQILFAFQVFYYVSRIKKFALYFISRLPGITKTLFMIYPLFFILPVIFLIYFSFKFKKNNDDINVSNFYRFFLYHAIFRSHYFIVWHRTGTAMTAR